MGDFESAYNARDLELTYQYSNFGVPGLGLKRGLGENRVIAPYATGLATMVDPSAAAANFKRLATVGARGRFGFYEAVDFTPTRVQEGERFALIRAFMTHHQGMTIAGIANTVFDGAMRDRFMPSRSFGRRNCCCRSGFLGRSPRRGHGRRKSSLARAPATWIPRAGEGSFPFVNPHQRHSFFQMEVMP